MSATPLSSSSAPQKADTSPRSSRAGCAATTTPAWEKVISEKASRLVGREVDLGIGDDLWTNKNDGEEDPVWRAMGNFYNGDDDR